MRIRLLAIAMTGLAMLAAATARHFAQQAGPSGFPPKETLVYDVTWSIFDAGKVTVALQSASGQPGDDYHAHAVARSQGFVSLLFNVNDEFDSFFSPQSLCSHRITKKINEGPRHRDMDIVFDSARRLAVLREQNRAKPGDPPRHAENPIPECVQDIMSAFYYVRREPLQVGRTLRVPVNDGGKTYDISVEVESREPVQTGLGTITAFRLEPRVFGGFYQRKGRMWVWMSDDNRRLPLKVKMAISIGAITATLKSASTASGK